jgi:hypothetical protein
MFNYPKQTSEVNSKMFCRLMPLELFILFVFNEIILSIPTCFRVTSRTV